MHSFSLRLPGVRWCALIVFGLVIIDLAAQGVSAASFAGVYENTYGSTSRLDWSSDFGAPYIVSSYGYPHPGTISPAPWTSPSMHSDETLELYVQRHIGGGLLSSRNLMELGPAGAVSPAVVHTVTHDLQSTATSGYYGFFPSANTSLNFLFEGADATHPLYWGIEWHIDSEILIPSYHTGWSISHHTDRTAATLVNVPANHATGDVTGSAFGSSPSNVQQFLITTGVYGGPVTANAVYRIAFSDTPFDDIPDAPSPTLMPTPAAAGAGMIGLGLLALRRGRKS